jgi:DNA-binding CsgD family transcriptional regulator
VLWALQVLLDREGIVSRPRFIQLFGWLLTGSDRSTDPPPIRLSPREREVLELLGRGLSNTQISRELSISPHTVRTHIQNIQEKLEVHLSLETATLALQHGWPTGADDVEEPPVASVEDSLVMAALQQLASDQREVLLLRMFGGLTAPEVAAALGKTTGAVKALQHRGLASLARALGLRSSSEPSDRRYPSPTQLTRARRTSSRGEEHPAPGQTLLLISIRMRSMFRTRANSRLKASSAEVVPGTVSAASIRLIR